VRASSAGGNVGVGCVETLAWTWASINEPLCVEMQHVKPFARSHAPAWERYLGRSSGQAW